MTKEKFAWTGFGVPLTWLAELDNVSSPNALPEAFGDSYLCRHNPIFRAVRDAAVGFGYRFSAEDTPLWRDYQAISLAALHRILSGKTIPFFDTASAFRRLIAVNPSARLPPAFIVGNLKRNYAFHESAHCVAHSILRLNEAALRAVAPHETDRVVLEAILAESFANSVEILGSVFRHMPVSDGVFYSLNSYFSHDQRVQDRMSKAAAEMNAELRFTLLFLSYFEANLATEAPPDSAWQRIAETAGCPADRVGSAREIADTAFRLSAGFRESTTPAYFELLGCTREYNALAKSDWLSRPRNQGLARVVAQLFWEAAGKA
jgi:hypothetical protein